jgi:polyisoprenyl-phosphate glycosyltransferase
MESMISVVLPVFNEESVISELFRRVKQVLEQLDYSYEIICVDDGSSDQSFALLSALAMRDPCIKIVRFSRNFGHQLALSAGLAHSSGQAVIIMDADLQDPPELMSRFIEQWQQGYEVVYAVRQKRQEGFFKRTAYALFYRSLQMMTDLKMPLDAGDFCLLDRRVVDVLTALPEHNRFLRGLRSWVGFQQTAVTYERAARHSGNTKYTLRKLFRLALSGYVGFSAMPLRMAAWLGLCSAGAGFLLTLWAIGCKILQVPSPWGWASTIAVVLFIGGIQLLVLGAIGEYLSRVYDEVRQRPLYIVRERIGFSSSPVAADADSSSAYHAANTQAALSV